MGPIATTPVCDKCGSCRGDEAMGMKLPLIEQIKVDGLPAPTPEHEFCPGRKWRFDWCWPDRMLAVEVDGGVWTQGRHTRGAGYEEDCRKLNRATILGWRVLRFTTRQVAKGEALACIREALAAEM